MSYAGNGFSVEQIPFDIMKKQMLSSSCGWNDLYSDEDRGKLLLAETLPEIIEIANKYEKIWEKINRI